jgi:hypothetical protein
VGNMWPLMFLFEFKSKLIFNLGSPGEYAMSEKPKER